MRGLTTDETRLLLEDEPVCGCPCTDIDRCSGYVGDADDLVIQSLVSRGLLTRSECELVVHYNVTPMGRLVLGVVLGTRIQS